MPRFAADPPALRRLSRDGEIAAFDRAHFGADRGAFLRRWNDPQAAAGWAASRTACSKRSASCAPAATATGSNPLFALDRAAAERSFAALSAVAVGAPLFLDVTTFELG